MCDTGVSEVSGIQSITRGSSILSIQSIQVLEDFPGFSRVIPGLSRVILGGLSRVIYSYTGLSRVYTGFIQGYLGLFTYIRKRG